MFYYAVQSKSLSYEPKELSPIKNPAEKMLCHGCPQFNEVLADDMKMIFLHEKYNRQIANFLWNPQFSVN